MVFNLYLSSIMFLCGGMCNSPPLSGSPDLGKAMIGVKTKEIRFLPLASTEISI